MESIELNIVQRIGRTWFRWRSLSPVPFLILMLFLKPDFQIPAVSYLSILGILAAEMLRIWAVGYAGSGTRTRCDSVGFLVCEGPYHWSRNPLYVANILMYTLCALLFGFSVLALVLFIYSVVQYSLIVFYEEELLERSFGERYLAYRLLVPRWFPMQRPLQILGAGSNQPFDLKGALRSERSTFIAMGVMGMIYLLKNFLGFLSPSY